MLKSAWPGYRNSQWRKIDLKRLDFSQARTWPLEDGSLGIQETWLPLKLLCLWIARGQQKSARINPSDLQIAKDITDAGASSVPGRAFWLLKVACVYRMVFEHFYAEKIEIAESIHPKKSLCENEFPRARHLIPL